MRGSDGASLVQQQQHHHHHHHDQRQILALPTTCVLRAFQLEEWASASAQADSELLREGEADPATAALSRAAGAATAEVWQPATCAEYLAAMAAVRQVCDEEGAVPLYHYTSPESARFIVSSGLRMSTQGQGDGGVYFSTLGPASYDLGTSKYEENIIVDCFGKERLEEYRGQHKLDVLLVYSVNPKIAEQAPGGRDNAKMVSKNMFETFAVSAAEDGQYYLRPDRIRAAILLDGTSGLPTGRDAALEGLETEKLSDVETRKVVDNMAKETRANSASSLKERQLMNMPSSHDSSSSMLTAGGGGGRRGGRDAAPARLGKWGWSGRCQQRA